MRHLLPLALSVVIALGFSAPASAAEPANDVIHLVHGLFATSAQLSMYAACWVALDDEDTCVQLADKARNVVSRE